MRERQALEQVFVSDRRLMSGALQHLHCCVSSVSVIFYFSFSEKLKMQNAEVLCDDDVVNRGIRLCHVAQHYYSIGKGKPYYQPEGECRDSKVSGRIRINYGIEDMIDPWHNFV